MRRPQRRYTPRRPREPVEDVAQRFKLARHYRRVAMRLVGASAMRPNPEAEAALARADARAAKASGWPERVEIIEREAAGVFSPELVESLRGQMDTDGDTLSPRHRAAYVAVVEETMGGRA